MWSYPYNLTCFLLILNLSIPVSKTIIYQHVAFLGSQKGNTRLKKNANCTLFFTVKLTIRANFTIFNQFQIAKTNSIEEGDYFSGIKTHKKPTLRKTFSSLICKFTSLTLFGSWFSLNSFLLVFYDKKLACSLSKAISLILSAKQEC